MLEKFSCVDELEEQPMKLNVAMGKSLRQPGQILGRSSLFLWLWVINLGIALGAGLYESRIVVPQWLIALPEAQYQWNAEAARQANVGLEFWIFVSTIPLTVLTLANLFLAFRSRGKVRRYWIGAAAVTLVERLLTFLYFIPTMIRLMSGDLPDVEAVTVAQQWIHFNSLRHLLVLVAWLGALKVLALSGRSWERRKFPSPG